jgi:putative Mg2+ transporter-C (MgtC) family protein
MQLAGNDGATRVLAYIASGVGFLGAGVIMKDGANVRGLNTAATIWCSAVTGAYAGADHPLGALAMCAFVLIGNTFLRPLVNYIERAPIDESATELTIEVRVCTTEARRNDLRETLLEGLDAAAYPLRDIREIYRDNEVELVATLATTSARAQDLDRLTTSLAQTPGVVHATWTSRAEE